MQLSNLFTYKYQNGDNTTEAQSAIILGSPLTYKNCFLRLLSFLCDVIFMLWPFILFVLAFVLMISPLKMGIKFIYNSIYINIFIISSILLWNTLSTLYYCGQTIGQRMYQLKVVNYDGQETSLWKAFFRELLGKSIPLVFLFTYYRTFGILIYIIVNGIVVFLDPKHRGIIDFIFHTKVVFLYYEASDFQVDNRMKINTIYHLFAISLQFIKRKISSSKRVLESYIHGRGKKAEYLQGTNIYVRNIESTHKRQSLRKYHKKNGMRKHYKRRKRTIDCK